jgi:hypothetical protein
MFCLNWCLLCPIQWFSNPLPVLGVDATNAFLTNPKVQQAVQNQTFNLPVALKHSG